MRRGRGGLAFCALALVLAGSLPARAATDTLPLGGTLLLADDPEDVPGPGILAEGWVRGPVRVLVDEHNAGTLPLGLRVELYNPHPTPVEWQPGGEGGAESSPSGVLLASARALTRFLGPHARLPVVAVAPHGWLGLTPRALRPRLEPGEVGLGVVDGIAFATVEIFVVARGPGPRLAPLPPVPHRALMRGVFPEEGIVDRIQVSARHPSRVDLGRPGTPLEDPSGYSALDRRPAADPGGYGLETDLVLAFRGRPPPGIRLELVPRGGPFSGAIEVTDGSRAAVRALVSPVARMRLRLTVPPGGIVRLRVFVAAGSFLPVEVRVVPTAHGR